MDTSKHIFQLHGVNAAEEPVLRKKLRRKEMFAFLEKLAPTVIAIEACGASHHCARLLRSFGHSVKLIAPQLVKPYIKRGKNDAVDAEALCEAMSRPTMRFVPVKTAEQQAALMLVGVRDRLIRNRTQLSNAIRGYAGEFGLTAAKGKAHLHPLLERIQADESLPALARELFAAQAQEYAQLQAQIDEVDARLMAWHRADECSRRLVKIPGVGPHGKLVLGHDGLGGLGAAGVFRHPEVVEEQPWVPVELADFLGDVGDASGLDQADGETAQTGDVFRAVAGADPAAIFVVDPVEDVMAGIFDGPVTAVDLEDAFGVGLLG